MHEGAKLGRRQAVAALAALVMAGCGGGGGADDGMPLASGPPAPPPPAPAPTPDPGTPGAPVVTDRSLQTEPNRIYEVTAEAGMDPVILTLPSLLALGDTVSVRGLGSGEWRLGQNPGQSITTAGLAANAATGTAWAPRLEPQPWWWVASDQSGSVLVAAANQGLLHISRDAGDTWDASTSPPAQRWDCVAMTPAGRTMVAVAFEGGLYISQDTGETWRQVAEPGGGAGQTQWQSAAISEDSRIVAATVYGGPIYISRDGGLSFEARGGVRQWRGMAMSRDGRRMVAACDSDRIYVSEDGGDTWTPRRQGAWYRAAASADGMVMAAAERFSGDLVLSRDGGQTWTAALLDGAPLEGHWTTLAISDDGQRIVASRDTGLVMTGDAGVSWRVLDLPQPPAPATATWRSVAMSGDGHMLVAATGFIDRPGQLYTSRSNRTATGEAGSVGGGQDDAVEVRYTGEGRFDIVAWAGSLEVR